MLLLAAAIEELGALPGLTVGIGPIVAAAGTARILAEHKPNAVLLVGTCGAYPRGPAIGMAITAERVGLSPGVAAMGMGYVPRPPQPITCDRELLERIHLPRHDVLTVGAITTDPKLVERLSDGWSIEHMEAFGVAFACQQAGVPFACILGVANDVGPEAHVQWLSNREAAQEAARRVVRDMMP